MRKYVLLWAAILCLTMVSVWTAAPAHAQDVQVPVAINDALQDLSARVGRPVTLNEIFQWRWVGDIFPDTSLGCPQPGQFYTQVQTPGFQFLLNYQGVTYDYRVSADRGTVILCDGDNIVTTPAQIAPLVPELPLDTGLAQPLCQSLLPGLSSGEQVQVSAGVNQLHMRAQPSLTAPIIARIPSQSSLLITDGPVCDAQGIVWWQVALATASVDETDADTGGWVAEGRAGALYLQAAGQQAEITELAVGDFCGLLPTRLEAGQQARVSANLGRLNLRAAPALTGALIAQMQPNELVTVTGAPVCTPNGILYWQLQYGALTGWAAEGQRSVYYLEPLALDATVDPAAPPLP